MRARTTLLATLVVGVALAAGAVILLLSLQNSLVRSGDAAAVAKARDLAAVVDSGGLPSTVTAPGEDDVVQVVDSAGRVVAASDNASGWPPIASFRPDGGAPVVRTAYDVADGSDLEDYRVWGVRAGTDEQPMVVYVGTSLEAVSEATAQLRAALAVGLPVMVALRRLQHLVDGRADAAPGRGDPVGGRRRSRRWPWTAACRSRPRTTRSAGWPRR